MKDDFDVVTGPGPARLRLPVQPPAVPRERAAPPPAREDAPASPAARPDDPP
jgi:hypothetical protein